MDTMKYKCMFVCVYMCIVLWCKVYLLYVKLKIILEINWNTWMFFSKVPKLQILFLSFFLFLSIPIFLYIIHLFSNLEKELFLLINLNLRLIKILIILILG